MTRLAISYLKQPDDAVAALAQKLQLPVITPEQMTSFDAILIYREQQLTLQLAPPSKLSPLTVNFTQGKIDYRCRNGGGRQQLLARAMGLHKQPGLTILDVTAGLGGDAYVLAHLGAQVTMIERHPVIAALLEDGLQRAQHKLSQPHLTLNLIIADATDYLRQLESPQRPQVIYLDPMFPDSKNTALAKKEMRILRQLVGDDDDAQLLLTAALKTATRRVVVKRPKLADPIPGPTPNLKMIGKSNRFDIYLV